MTVLTDAFAHPAVTGWLPAAAIGIGVALTIVFSRTVELRLKLSKAPTQLLLKSSALSCSLPRAHQLTPSQAIWNARG